MKPFRKESLRGAKTGNYWCCEGEHLAPTTPPTLEQMSPQQTAACPLAKNTRKHLGLFLAPRRSQHSLCRAGCRWIRCRAIGPRLVASSNETRSQNCKFPASSCRPVTVGRGIDRHKVNLAVQITSKLQLEVVTADVRKKHLSPHWAWRPRT